MAACKKNARRRDAWIVFEDESGLALNHALTRTWAPRGKTPVLATRYGNRKQISMAGLLAYHPDGRRARILFQTIDGGYNDEQLIIVIRQMRRTLRANVTLIWDRLTAHRSRRMQAFLRRQQHWLRIEELPPYAYDLNPCEALWASLKARELANLCPHTVQDCVDAAQSGVQRVRRERHLAFNFLRRSRLSLHPTRH
ncbi:MAG: transposase [Burkholderiales bacterium]